MFFKLENILTFQIQVNCFLNALSELSHDCCQDLIMITCYYNYIIICLYVNFISLFHVCMLTTVLLFNQFLRPSIFFLKNTGHKAVYFR